MSETIHKVEEILAKGEWQGAEVDQVTLDYEDRFRRRMVLDCDQGTKVLLELSNPKLLQDGDGLKLQDGSIILVIAASEKLVEIRGDGLHHMLRIAWHLGNRHLPTQIFEDHLVIRHDYVIIDMVKGLGGQVKDITAPFTPEGGAYGHGAVHGHDHHHG